MTKTARGRQAVGRTKHVRNQWRTGRAGAPTLKDIAKVARVSAQTVSLVVNDKGSVSDKVRERIRRIADRLGYRPNKSAKTMRTGRSQTLGLVISDIRSPFFPELAHVVERAAAEAGYALLLVDTHGPKDEAAERIASLKDHGVDGVVATEYSPPIGRLDLPTVIIGDPVRGMDSITSDDEMGGGLLADYLLRRGHRRFGLVTSPVDSSCLRERREAFLERVHDKADVVWEVYTPILETITGEIRDALSGSDATAVICSHDVVAIGVMRALKDQGRLVPADVSVVGFDDIPWASIVTPALTTVRQPFEGLGRGAIELLVERIARPERRARRIKLPVNLVERDTVSSLAPPVARRRRAPALAQLSRASS